MLRRVFRHQTVASDTPPFGGQIRRIQRLFAPVAKLHRGSCFNVLLFAKNRVADDHRLTLVRRTCAGEGNTGQSLLAWLAACDPARPHNGTSAMTQRWGPGPGLGRNSRGHGHVSSNAARLLRFR